MHSVGCIGLQWASPDFMFDIHALGKKEIPNSQVSIMSVNIKTRGKKQYILASKHHWYHKLKFYRHFNEVCKIYVFKIHWTYWVSWGSLIKCHIYIYWLYREPYSWNMNPIKRMQDIWEYGKNRDWCESLSLITGQEKKGRREELAVNLFVCLHSVFSPSPCEPDLPL